MWAFSFISVIWRPLPMERLGTLGCGKPPKIEIITTHYDKALSCLRASTLGTPLAAAAEPATAFQACLGASYPPRRSEYPTFEGRAPFLSFRLEGFNR